MESINYVQIFDKKSALLPGFLNVYKKAFGGPPYYESYEDEWLIENVWNNHIENGCLILAVREGVVIGVGCCINFVSIKDSDPNIEINNFLLNNEKVSFDVSKTCYMSELAVLDEFRANGIGTSLICRRFQWAKENGMKFYVMRTALEGSMSEKIYSELGAVSANIIQEVSHHAEIVNSSSKKRKFLFNEL